MVPSQPGWQLPAHRPLEPADPIEVGGYRLRARLGEGGMGVVYLSYTPGGRPLAIKVVRGEYAGDPGFRRRFEQEVATARRVQGQYTAPVVDANPQAPQPWLATTYVPGPSLQQAVGEYGPLPAESVLVLVAGMAEALQSIHAAGVVHRDLKPSNVILAVDGPRVIDFGIARAVDSTSITQTGSRLGTAAYMAPEQVRGDAATPALDVFALGAVACYAATGELPFGGGLDPAVPYRILEQEPELAALPPQLHGLVSRCLAKDPRHRPTPTQVIDLCRTASTGTRLQMGSGWLPPVVAAAVSRIASLPAPPVPRGPRKPRRARVALVSAILAAAVASVATFAALHGSGNPPGDRAGDRAGGPTGSQPGQQPTGGGTASQPAGAGSGNTQTASDGGPSILAHETVRLAEDLGIDVGSVPLKVDANSLSVSFYLSNRDLDSNTLINAVGNLSPWSADQPPSEEQCADLLRTQPVKSLGAKVGLRFCAVGNYTPLVAYIRVLSFDGSAIQLDVTVWNRSVTD
jgi:hypothetical protein